MAKDERQAGTRQRPEQKRGGDRGPEPFTKDGEYDSLDQWEDEDER